ncbi:hypothetical protein B0T18DRAFT_423339, partial [Schizothecium vesticola]
GREYKSFRLFRLRHQFSFNSSTHHFIQTFKSNRPPQTVHLTFHGGPASYSLSFPADGVIRQTNNNIAVNIIDAPDYNALTSCTFYTSGEKPLSAASTLRPARPDHHRPPQPVTAVRCEVLCADDSDCYRNGQYGRFEKQ